ncbi:hypothetical protein RFI_30118 [Reticulomyxa filosa]|uniref:Uncharacterized protein n=1 Tax=Reticulomyxa filosa TaxID=46433 RepID=X6LZB9_RETFI|nr:hypothetical protein RFI_30118 [Reticulomyxa filosa]|eukprot:ETO07273.1 hypothetical protein RFI_30118 [Reticulomyxa filosa]
MRCKKNKKKKKKNVSASRVYTQMLSINGRLFVVGGEHVEQDNGRKNTGEEFDWNTKEWQILPPMSCRRWNHCACVLHSYEDSKSKAAIPPRIFVAGGWNPTTKEYLLSCEIYNTATNQWESILNMKYVHSCATAIEWKSRSKILVIGGQAGLLESKKTAKSPSGRENSKDKDASANNTITSMVKDFGNFRCVEVFDMKTQQWSQWPSLNSDHGFYPAVWCSDDDEKIYVAGNGTSPQTCIEFWDSRSHSWKVLDDSIPIGESKCRRMIASHLSDDLLEKWKRSEFAESSLHGVTKKNKINKKFWLSFYVLSLWKKVQIMFYSFELELFVFMKKRFFSTLFLCQIQKPCFHITQVKCNNVTLSRFIC